MYFLISSLDFTILKRALFSNGGNTLKQFFIFASSPQVDCVAATDGDLHCLLLVRCCQTYHMVFTSRWSFYWIQDGQRIAALTITSVWTRGYKEIMSTFNICIFMTPSVIEDQVTCFKRTGTREWEGQGREWLMNQCFIELKRGRKLQEEVMRTGEREREGGRS